MTREHIARQWPTPFEVISNRTRPVFAVGYTLPRGSLAPTPRWVTCPTCRGAKVFGGHVCPFCGNVCPE